MLHVFRGALLLVWLGLGACSPTFNWREWPVEGTPLRAMMPCKPETATRSVPLLGTPVDLHMHSCETGGQRFALAWVDVGRADQLPAAREAWRRASLQSLRVAPEAAADPARVWSVLVAGATEVQGVQASGMDPQGEAVEARMAFFAHDGRLYQAAVYAVRPHQEAMDTFFGGLQLPPP